MAREAGASVMILESAPKEWRGGNSQHTRNLRCMHDAAQDVLVESYPEEEFWQDLLKVTGGVTNEKLARMVIRASSSCRDWIRKHGERFLPALTGSLNVARTNAFFMRGGNSQHTRNLRCMHDAPQYVLVESYPEEEFWKDLLKVTGGVTNEKLARLVIRASSSCRDWMRKHGVRFQPSLSGTLHVARTNAFFMGGGKALVNAYYRSAENLGVQIRYDAPVDALELDGDRFVAARIGAERIEARACVVASGGFESNREWLREAWGQNEAGEWPADNFLIRGTRFNMGVLLKYLLDAGVDSIGDPTQSHSVAIDARAPLYDGGICTRVDCVSLGVVVNRDAKSFYDEGEDFWPKRYAVCGRLVAKQPGQIAYSILDDKEIEIAPV